MDYRESFGSMIEALKGIGSESQARKLVELQDKQSDGDFAIAFCGHFSAGKSTLVNRLCGHRLLPSSPIPTSANVVRIRNGEASAHIFRKPDGSGEPQVERIGLGELEEACKDGEGIESVEIRYPIPLLGKHTVLLDTPGIDSTDDAHQAATQSAMHLADIVFYVMDYNYVQSEINFTFAKKLQDAGKALYLIINQIDKHRERELSFESYRSGVEEAFRSWNLQPAGMLFLSLKDEHHPHNDWHKLPLLIEALITQSSRLKAWTTKQTAAHLVREALKDWKESRELEKALYREACGEEDGIQEALDEEKRIQQQLEELHATGSGSLQRWKKELQSIIDGANLTPAVTRDLAAAYLETRKPGFKLGFFSRAAKTEEERQRRLEAFRHDLEEKAKAHLYWHASDYLKQQAAQEGLQSEELRDSLEELQKPLSAEWLAGHVHTGPDFTGEYVLNYCRLISGELKQQCRQACFTILEDMMLPLLAERAKAGLEALHERSRELAVRLAAVKGLERMAEEEREQEKKLQHAAQGMHAAVGDLQLPDLKSLDQAAGRKRELQAASVVKSAATTPIHAKPISAPLAAVAAGNAGSRGPRPGMAAGPHRAHNQGQALVKRLNDTADRLEQAAAALEGLEGAGLWIQTLKERAAKLRNNRFTLALFGAFSAGKSSFANAWMGERVLPVSPNPTTAAINTILPPTSEYPNGTVRVLLKTEEAIREEIAYSLQALGLDVAPQERQEAEALLNRIRRLRPEDSSASGKPHYTFLKAVEKGWAEMSPHLGGELITGRDQFQAFVATESKSCFATLVELYQTTPLSEHGVVLVDTPGADSINARHTGVAFNYMKNADAILFVTYYNHAFSQADREFLLQLGRVKDALQLDKMFFLVNAADLASSPQELTGVLSHVEDNLLRFGIRNPRMFPVSSLLAVEAKSDGDEALLSDSGFPAFEEAFGRFANTELGDMAAYNADQEVRRASALLDQWIQAAQQNAEDRSRKLQVLTKAEEEALALVRSEWRLLQEDRSGIRKELEEQLYYVKQRTGFRFAELYRLAFNPAALREDGRELKQAFKAAWQDLLRLVGVHLSQEVLAVTLRMEQYMSLLLKEKWSAAGGKLSGIVPDYEHAGYEKPEFRTPEVEEMPVVQEPDMKWLLGFYRNGRAFFEGDGSAKLMQALEGIYTAAADQYVKEHAERLAERYLHQLEEQVDDRSGQLSEALSSYCRGLRAALSPGADLATLLNRKARIDLLLNHAE